MATGTVRDDGPFTRALLLAGLAGWVDAAGLTGTGGLFISFMSGNTTEFAASVSRQEWLRAAAIGGILVLFVAGVAVGEALESRSERHGPAIVLSFEAIFLAAGAAIRLFGIEEPLGFYPLVFAMGLQNATMHRAAGISIGLTYVTGTLVQIGRGLVGGGTGRPAAHFVLWLCLAVGAALATLALSVSVVATLFAAAAGAASLAATTAVTRGR